MTLTPCRSLQPGYQNTKLGDLEETQQRFHLTACSPSANSGHSGHRKGAPAQRFEPWVVIETLLASIFLIHETGIMRWLLWLNQVKQVNKFSQWLTASTKKYIYMSRYVQWAQNGCWQTCTRAYKKQEFVFSQRGMKMASAPIMDLFERISKTGS